MKLKKDCIDVLNERGFNCLVDSTHCAIWVLGDNNNDHHLGFCFSKARGPQVYCSVGYLNVPLATTIMAIESTKHVGINALTFYKDIGELSSTALEEWCAFFVKNEKGLIADCVESLASFETLAALSPENDRFSHSRGLYLGLAFKLCSGKLVSLHDIEKAKNEVIKTGTQKAMVFKFDLLMDYVTGKNT